ncbi:uroporphyrinogen-III C-methyltransferase [Poritiphilus flavus]|uniref:uroporphyrinogen-III C-methyltransferase n=1 Tax=Poritiphilus flavus TaxID=2697053 RepID=A0A6L9E7E8_9FLAO|nr:uroporphyrinogen-III C-methyltransferase [Poritiphilus flavus]NAS10561.1 uroporphyrinogen-III C-methyltransferase [Poritiphilus flavus]
MKPSEKTAQVTLVGAGPGSKDLITIGGLRALRNADAVLYDALVDLRLLEEVSDSIPKIYVGKRCGEHSLTQEEINSLLVAYAFSHGHVVRLKGGDPFVFGRSSEEIAHLESMGIPVKVIPGVSSAIAVPSGQGIPMTKRGVASSFWVMTATKRDGSFSEDLELAAKSLATLVILMGVRRITEIARKIGHYRGGLTPIALIQNGAMSNESCIVGTLNDVHSLFTSVDTSKPGVIVVGDVVCEHPSFFEEEVWRVLHSAI